MIEVQEIATLVKATVFDGPDGLSASPDTSDGLSTKVSKALLARYDITPKVSTT